MQQPWSTAADRLAACLREGWRIVQDPLVCVADLGHAARLVYASREAYDGGDVWAADPLSEAASDLSGVLWAEDPLLEAVQDLSGALWTVHFDLTGDDCVW